MAITKSDARQWPLAEIIRFNVGDVEAGEVAMADLQGGEVVVGGSLTVVTAWNTTGAATVDLGDADTGDRYLDGVNLKAAARTALTLTGYSYPSAAELVATFAFADTAATEGEAILEFTVLREGRQSETA